MDTQIMLTAIYGLDASWALETDCRYLTWNQKLRRGILGGDEVSLIPRKLTNITSALLAFGCQYNAGRVCAGKVEVVQSGQRYSLSSS